MVELFYIKLFIKCSLNKYRAYSCSLVDTPKSSKQKKLKLRLEFHYLKHYLQLNLNICKGERPEIQCYVNLMKRSWDEDPHLHQKLLKKYKMKIEDISKKIKKRYYGFKCTNWSWQVFKVMHISDIVFDDYVRIYI